MWREFLGGEFSDFWGGISKFCWGNFLPLSGLYATLQDGKSGQIRDRIPNSGHFSVPNDLVFFIGTGPQNSGLSRKIRDGWSPYTNYNQ